MKGFTGTKEYLEEVATKVLGDRVAAVRFDTDPNNSEIELKPDAKKLSRAEFDLIAMLLRTRAIAIVGNVLRIIREPAPVVPE